MDWRTLPVAEWLPDQPPLSNPGSTTALNVIPGPMSYLPFPSPETYSQATGSANRVRGAVSIQDRDGVTYVYAGDAGKLYELSATAWDDVSKSGDYSGTATTEVWRFAQWGNQLIATNYMNDLQQITAGASNFTDVAGSPPRARHVAVIRDFLVLANVNDGTARPNRVQWSAFNNITSWTANVATQADSQDLQEGGHIKGLIGGEYGTIIQERAVSRMVYVGPPLIFQFDEVERSRGTQISGSVTAYGGLVFFWGEDEVWLFNGQMSEPIARNKTAQTIFDDFDGTYKDRVVGAIDPRNTLACWLYPGSGHMGGQPNRMAIYNWTIKRWAIVEVEVEMLTNFLSPGYTLDGLDAVSTSIDALPASLDDPVWMGGRPNFAGFDSSHRLITFSGAPLDGMVETTELRAAPGRHLEITNVRPLVEGGSYTAAIGTRQAQDAVIDWGAVLMPNSLGECNVRKASRFARVRISASGDWKHIQGADILARQAGRR